MPCPLKSALQCLTLSLCCDAAFPLAVIAVVSSMHLWPPSNIWHNNAPVPVWPHDTNEIGIWKWGTMLWHWITVEAVSRSCDQNKAKRILRRLSEAAHALPALWVVIKHTLKLMKILTECSNWRALLCLFYMGVFSNLRPWYMILMFYCGVTDTANGRPALLAGLVTCVFGMRNPCEQLWVNHGQPGPKKPSDVCLVMLRVS